jgi:hypothetical protein
MTNETALADPAPMVALATPGVPPVWRGTAHGDALAHARALRAIGCTLAAATAALLAMGNTMAQALAKAQGYTQRALAASYAIAPGQRIPQR